MKCLSIRQPWAELIIQGVKDIENRKWGTTYRGPLLIHTSKTFGKKERDEHARLCHRYDLPYPDSYVHGSIIGSVQLCGVIAEDFSHLREWHLSGMVGWYLMHPVRFEQPIPYKGKLSLFEVPDKIIPPEHRR